MNYILEAINGNLYSDQLFYEGVLEHLDVERDFMLLCLENNIILEADTPETNKKTNWLQVIKDTIKKIFDKFIENTKNLFKVDQKWISENIPKIKEINFEGLSVPKVTPYWDLEVNSIINTLSNLQKEITSVKVGDVKLKDLQTREQVENYGKFKNFSKANSSFSDEIKKFFMIDEENASKTVPLAGNALKVKCVSEMSDYVMKYNSTIVPSLQNSRKNFEQILNNVERELNKNKPVGESFCVIENAYYFDTELSLCENYNILTEAEETKTETKVETKPDDKNEPKLGQVKDETKFDNKQPINKEGNVEYYNYVKNAIQLNQIALAAAITSCERRYKLYMTILKGVISARSK